MSTSAIASLSRRRFLRQFAMAGLVAPWVTRDLLAQSASAVLRHAAVGAGGMGASDIQSLTSHPAVKLVAVADVELRRAQALQQRFPGLRVYQDWRLMLEKEQGQIDSVNVSTPDHMHAPVAMTALQMGLHVYVQKPLSHDIYESRRLTEVAREKKRVSQMGIQIHSYNEYRLAVKLVQEGVIGKIKEVHTWSNKKWGDPAPRPDRADPVPEGFDWDLWLGVCAPRPFIGNGYYHPANWRKRLDFGTGTFGDMGCHIYDPVFKALALTAPLSVRSEGPPPNAYNWANDAKILYVFPGTRFTEGKTVNVTWYDGDQRPPRDIQALLPRNLPDQGSIFIGTKGIMLLPHIAKPELYPDAAFRDFVYPKLDRVDHYHSFVDACLGRGQTSAGFDYSGPLTEAVLLGGVATRFPQTTLKWNAERLSFDLKNATALVRRAYRKGWEVKGLS
ncbi:Gfo/Idh/MocA family oxidoreductase [Fontisphaera persica]|uniref:Gfo/Idh/MocA family protein n=1 Tax=Fontisphaera persica TaxID=2974023 RepID=UPI0024BFE8DE|nr:Gfo/Idh/MocA family oxidoreductase [Fontisphaera persica]WCJ61001.1 Gfo/Idh/MocA family oxidoreductase [Fontisphaera persica]